MSRAEPPSPEPKPCGLRPHICCAPPPLAPTSLGSAPLLPRAEPRRGAARPGQPAGGGGPREPPAPSEPAPDSGWLSADESSGYESESAERGAAAEGPRGRQRRARTAFSAAQLGGLEETFRRRRYLGAAERRQLAAALHLSETQVKFLISVFPTPPLPFYYSDQNVVSEPADEAEEASPGAPAPPASRCPSLQLRPGRAAPRRPLPARAAPGAPPAAPRPRAAARPPLPGLRCTAEHLPFYGKRAAFLPSKLSSASVFPCGYSEQNGQALPSRVCVIVKAKAGQGRKILYAVISFVLLLLSSC